MKKKADINILKLVKLDQKDADRIIGGLIRLETNHDLTTEFFEKCLSLGETEPERNYIWYNIGVKIGALVDAGYVLPFSVYKKLNKDFSKSENETNNDPSVQ